MDKALFNIDILSQYYNIWKDFIELFTEFNNDKKENREELKGFSFLIEPLYSYNLEKIIFSIKLKDTLSEKEYLFNLGKYIYIEWSEIFNKLTNDLSLLDDINSYYSNFVSEIHEMASQLGIKKKEFLSFVLFWNIISEYWLQNIDVIKILYNIGYNIVKELIDNIFLIQKTDGFGELFDLNHLLKTILNTNRYIIIPNWWHFYIYNFEKHKKTIKSKEISSTLIDSLINDETIVEYILSTDPNFFNKIDKNYTEKEQLLYILSLLPDKITVRNKEYSKNILIKTIENYFFEKEFINKPFLVNKKSFLEYQLIGISQGNYTKWKILSISLS